jgi:predicted ABC-type ATPase
MPTLYVIAGPNGAGKTTASKTLLPDVLDCREFVNADAIAAGLSPFQPESVAFLAGRIMLERIQHLISKRETFAIETTLSTKSYKALITQAKSLGYEIVLLYFWLESPELAIERVKHRVQQGGHNIPEDVIRRRYAKGLKNLFEIFIPVADDYWIFDNSHNQTELVFKNENNETEIIHQETWQKIKTTYENTK